MAQTIKDKQPTLVNRFQRTYEQQRFVHAYLFEGPPGTGKQEMARWIAQLLFCEHPIQNEPCGACRNCTRVEEHDLPDLIEVEPDGQSIKVDQIRQMKTEFSKRAMEQTRKVYIVRDAEKMTVSAANSLLTFLEEPGEETYIFLLTTAKENLLPTIRSRCQLVHFQPLHRAAFEALLEAEGMKPEDASFFAAVTNDVSEAIRLQEDPQIQSLRKKAWEWFTYLFQQDPNSYLFIQMNVMEEISEKQRAVQFLDFVLFHYRDLLSLQHHLEENLIHRHLQSEYQELFSRSNRHPFVPTQMETILEAKQMLEQNIQVQGVLERIALLSMPL